ncbi:longitudinals lacking protein, isoforms H/M/V-like [Drosophila pseudoobscura]|uniref:Longitudinals lacking protein, isoforms H/M/V-like n=1 Tax=Drosophila pseudoobscura pseudoobscura TaxID=46245 RepID=A0A6I8VXB0_DROPS|nr:longitudinals lacking protein, isoforms H/M/V [Drosophila pseudoobscura]
MANKKFLFRWNDHQRSVIGMFESLRLPRFAAEGQSLKAYKVVLSACSPYFAALLGGQDDRHPIFVLKERGEVNVSQDQLDSFLKAAESLQISGLSEPQFTVLPEPGKRARRHSSGSGGDSKNAARGRVSTAKGSKPLL